MMMGIARIAADCIEYMYRGSRGSPQHILDHLDYMDYENCAAHADCFGMPWITWIGIEQHAVLGLRGSHVLRGLLWSAMECHAVLWTAMDHLEHSDHVDHVDCRGVLWKAVERRGAP